jgi:hypothetical protein
VIYVTLRWILPERSPVGALFFGNDPHINPRRGV